MFLSFGNIVCVTEQYPTTLSPLLFIDVFRFFPDVLSLFYILQSHICAVWYSIWCHFCDTSIPLSWFGVLCRRQHSAHGSSQVCYVKSATWVIVKGWYSSDSPLYFTTKTLRCAEIAIPKNKETSKGFCPERLLSQRGNNNCEKLWSCKTPTSVSLKSCSKTLFIAISKRRKFEGTRRPENSQSFFRTQFATSNGVYVIQCINNSQNYVWKLSGVRIPCFISLSPVSLKQDVFLMICSKS